MKKVSYRSLWVMWVLILGIVCIGSLNGQGRVEPYFRFLYPHEGNSQANHQNNKNFYNDYYLRNDKNFRNDDDFHFMKIEHFQPTYRGQAEREAETIYLGDFARKHGESVNRYCKRIEKEMASNDKLIADAKKSGDIFHEIKVLRKGIKKSERAAACRECGKKADKYYDHQKKLEKQVIQLENKLKKKCDKLEDEVKSYDKEIAAVDRTHNLVAQINVRENVVNKSHNAADYGIKISETINCCGRRATEFYNYKLRIQKELAPLRAELKRRQEEEKVRQEAAKETERQQAVAEARKKAEQDAERERVAEEGRKKAEREATAAAEKERQRKAAEEEEIERNNKGSEQIRLEEEAFEAAGGEYLDMEIDGVQFAEGLGNVESMFNGQIAPDMDLFDNMMGTFLGEERQTRGDESASHFDSNIAGDYAISACEYRDDKFGVWMDIGRITKFADGVDFDRIGVDPMTLSGINVLPENGGITFALNGGQEKVLIKSDIDSLGNFVAQRRIEEKVYVQKSPDSIPNVEVDNLVIWGVDKRDTKKVRSIASVIIDFLPYVGTGKAVTELITGHDYIGGEDVSRIVSVCGVIGSVTPLPGGGKFAKVAAKAITKAAKKMTSHIKEMKLPTKYHTRPAAETEALRNEFYKNIRKNFLREYADTPQAIRKFSEPERMILKKGDTPPGWIVHHKKPLFRGGNNEFSNLRIMKKIIHNKYNQRLHHYEKGKNIYGLD